MSDHEIRLLTLNCWGLKYVSKNRLERIDAIARFLKNSTYDIITLQELWVYSDFEHVRDSVVQTLPNSKFFYSGALGAGLAIFTRFPIIEASVNPYSLNGAPMDVGAGDWFVGKAAVSVTILHPVLAEVQIFNTHLFAKGGDNWAHRIVNAWEFAKHARQSAELGKYVIAGGDFNAIPTDLAMSIIREHAAVSDAWSITHPNSLAPPSSSPPPLSPHLAAIERYGVTADSPINSWSAGKPLDEHALQSFGKRLDYVFFRQPRRPSRSSAPVLRPTSTRVVLTEKVPSYDFSYSDHFALECIFTIDVPQAGSSDANPWAGEASELSPAHLSDVIQELTNCYRLCQARSKRELTIFALCIGLLLAIAIGTAWLPHPWINPIFILFTVFLAWLGTTMLYQGFLYGNWEGRALRNVIEELEVYRKGLAIRNGQHRTSTEY